MKTNKYSLPKGFYLSFALFLPMAMFPLFAQENADVPSSPESSAISSKAEISTSDQDFLNQLDQACEKAVSNFAKENSQQSPENQRERARVETKNLLFNLDRYPDSQKGKDWIKFLLLNELLTSFAEEKQDVDILEKSISRFEYKAEGLDIPDFVQVRDVLKSYRRALKYQKSDDIKNDFASEAQEIRDAARRYLTYGSSNAGDAEIIANALEALNEFQPKSQNVQTIEQILANRFASPNFSVEFGSKFIPTDGIPVSRPVKVQEMIRGTSTYGDGVMTGTLTPQFIPNEQKAEIKLNLSASIKTNTVGYNRGVTVQSANTGNVVVTKSIFVADKIELGKTASGIQSDSKITGINTGRGPLGSQIVYDQINMEFPYSKAESENVMRYRVIEQFDSELNQQTNLANEKLTKLNTLLQEINFNPRLIRSKTTDSRLYWTALLGTPRQLGPANKGELSREYDYVIRIHESAFNNLFYAALAGKRISEEDAYHQIQKYFPNVIPGLSAIRPESASETSQNTNDPNASPEGNLFITFFEELPISVQMDNQMIRVQSRIELFEEDGKNLPGLDIDVCYALEQRDNDFFFVQKEIEAWPPELDRNAMIPARYQVIRNQVLKRLKDQVPEEIKIPPIQIPQELNEQSLSIAPPKKGEEALKTTGTLNASEVVIQDGWFLLGGDVTPVLTSDQENEEKTDTAPSNN